MEWCVWLQCVHFGQSVELDPINPTPTPPHFTQSTTQHPIEAHTHSSQHSSLHRHTMKPSTPNSKTHTPHPTPHTPYPTPHTPHPAPQAGGVPVVSIYIRGDSVPMCAGVLVSETHVLTSLECARLLRAPAGTDATMDGEGMGGTPAPDGQGVTATARIGNSTFVVHTRPPLVGWCASRRPLRSPVAALWLPDWSKGHLTSMELMAARVSARVPGSSQCACYLHT